MAATKSTTGLKKETSAALAYVLGPITGVIFLIVEKDAFVRFHAMQSIVVLGGLVALQWILGITFFLALLIPLVGILWFISWLVLIYKAWQGDEWEYPVLGKYARQILKKA
jgi:uncharacterized membrane protein